MNDVNLTPHGDMCFILSGALGFDTVPAIREQGISFFETMPEIRVDLKGVTHSDSAGLALLTEWMRFAKQHDKKITFFNIPHQMLAIARVSSLDNILPLARG